MYINNLLELYVNPEALKWLGIIVGIIVAVVIAIIIFCVSLRLYYVSKVIAILISIAVPVLYYCIKINVIQLWGEVSDGTFESDIINKDVTLSQMASTFIIIPGTGLWILYSFLAGAIDEDKMSASSVLVLLGLESPVSKAASVIAISIVIGLFGGVGICALTILVWEGFIYVISAIATLINIILVIVNIIAS